MKKKLVVMMKVDDLRTLIEESIANAIQKLTVPKQEEQLLKRTDVAKLFGISLVTLNAWMREGRIIYHRINSRVFFKHAEVMEALESVKRYSRKSI